MALEPMTEILARAREGGYAVGYFEAWDSYSLEAVVDAAEAEQAPVILGFGCLLLEQRWLEDGGIETLGCIGRHAAARARVPVALLLNEAHKLEHALRGIEAGFNAVMLCTNDADVTAGLVAQAHGRGVAVEAEVGELPAGAADGEVDTSHAALTDPDEAAEFVAATGVDCLGVSFGRGVAKFNIGTALKRAYLDVLSTAVISVGENESPHDVVGSHGPRDVLAAGKPSVVDAVRARIRLYGASGRAT